MKGEVEGEGMYAAMWLMSRGNSERYQRSDVPWGLS
jgi:hypothetical protein